MEEARTSEESYRIELMRLREKVTEARGKYRFVTIFTAMLAGLLLLSGEGLKAWLAVILLVALSIAAWLAYRDMLKRPRFWALVPVVLWWLPFGAGLCFALVGLVIGLLSGEISGADLKELYADWGFGDAFGLLMGLAIGGGLLEGVLTRAEAAFIEEHREEWLAYNDGRSLSSKRRKSARLRSEAAEG